MASTPTQPSIFSSFQQHWRKDLVAAISVAMVALPLGLGIAQAAGIEPVKGVITAIVGGLVATFLRGSHVGINGPSAGIITVILGALITLKDSAGESIPYLMAAVVVAGLIQVLMGLLKLGKLGDIFPDSVINGVLAAIGLIILLTQIDDALGFQYSEGVTTVRDRVRDLPNHLHEINPSVALLAFLSLLILAIYPRLKVKAVQLFPGPVWVLLFVIPLAWLFQFQDLGEHHILGYVYEVGPHYLIDLPENLMGNWIWPNFSMLNRPAFWLVVLSLTLISTIETLAAAKAVDKLDPEKRRTNLNKDLVGVGVATAVSGLLGGLPVITVIVRSSVNVQNHAHTRWSNFFHGLLLLIFLLLLSPVIEMIPFAALAGILIFTGYRLAGPKVWRRAYMLGWEQFLFVLITLVATLLTDLLSGLFIGIAVVILVQMMRANMGLVAFFSYLYRSSILKTEQGDDRVQFKMKGIANFLNLSKISSQLYDLPPGQKIQIDFSHTRLVDHTVLEMIQDWSRSYQDGQSSVEVLGRETLLTSTMHPNALHFHHPYHHKPITRRQNRLYQLAKENKWTYLQDIDWDASYLRSFQFFESRPLEYKENVIKGRYEDSQVEWEMADITFDEGALVAMEVYHSTVEILLLPETIPTFIMEHEATVDKVFERVRKFTGRKDLDFDAFPDFSSQYLLLGEDEAAIRAFFQPALIRFLEEHEIYHIESNGEALLMFRRLRLASAEEMVQMMAFGQELAQVMFGKEETEDRW